MRKLRLAFAMTLSSLMVLQSLLSPIAAWAEVANGQPSSLEMIESTDQSDGLDGATDGSQTVDQVVVEEDSSSTEAPAEVESASESDLSAGAAQGGGCLGFGRYSKVS